MGLALSNILPVIEVQLKYSPDVFRMSIKDEGRGMSAEALRAGKQDHWGIPGMNERAARIGARLKISSAPGAGTEVELEVPGDCAFSIVNEREH